MTSYNCGEKLEHRHVGAGVPVVTGHNKDLRPACAPSGHAGRGARGGTTLESSVAVKV